MAGGGGEAAVEIDLADLVRDRVHLGVARDALQDARRPAANGFVITIRYGQILARVAVGGRAEQEALLAEAHAPGVVVGAAQELELGPVRPEAEETLLEAVLLAADCAAEARVADHAVDPVVRAPPQVARPRVRVVREPAAEQD